MLTSSEDDPQPAKNRHSTEPHHIDKSATVESSPITTEEESNASSQPPAIIRRPVDEEESTALLESSDDDHHHHGHGHGHSHDADDDDEHGHSHGVKKIKKTIVPCLIMIVLTFAFFVVELVFGFINRSIALLADSYHMLSDVSALTVALVCLWIANRPSKYSTFGWVRAEVFGALINGVWLITMCYTIALESIGRLFAARAISNPLQIMIVGIIGFVINCVGIYIFHNAGVGHGHSHDGGDGGHGHSHAGGGHSHENGHGHSHEHNDNLLDVRPSRTMTTMSQDNCHNQIALRLVNLNVEESMRGMNEEGYDEEEGNDVQTTVKDNKNLNMHGAFLHIITDAIGSIIVICSAALALWNPSFIGNFILYIDPVLSLCLVAMITFSSVRLVRQTSEIILRLCPSFVDYARLKKEINKIGGIKHVSNITCWTLVANRHLATAEIEFENVVVFNDASKAVRHIFHVNGIHSLTIQPTFTRTGAVAAATH